MDLEGAFDQARGRSESSKPSIELSRGRPFVQERGGEAGDTSGESSGDEEVLRSNLLASSDGAEMWCWWGFPRSG